MLKKLKTLSAIAHLRTFLVDELSLRSGVSLPTVRTVLARCPTEWFTVTTEASGKGGQWKRYDLTLAGALAIDKELAKVPGRHVMPDPSSEAGDPPLSLLSARAKLAKLSGLAPEVAEALREQIDSNLQWAQAELTNLAVTSRSIDWMRELATLRAAAGLPFSEAQRRLALSLEPPREELAAATHSPPATDNWFRVRASDSVRHVRSFLERGPSKKPRPLPLLRQTSKSPCLAVLALDEKLGSQTLALAMTSLLGSVADKIFPQSACEVVSLRRDEMPVFMSEGMTMLTASLYCCIDSRESSPFPRSILEGLSIAMGPEKLVLVDRDHDSAIQRFADSLHISYQSFAGGTSGLQVSGWSAPATFPQLSFARTE